MNSIMSPKPLQYLIVICASVLLFIWGLPHTIALRNTMLAIGAVASLYFLIKYKPFVLDWNTTPLILIYCLPIWVLIHYYFFAQESDLQWLEIKSLWVRVVAGMLIATAMGVLIRKPDRINSLFIFAFFGMSFSILAVYLYQSFQVMHLLSPNEFLDKFLFDRNKVGVAFFSVVDLAVGCAAITYVFNCDNIKNYLFKVLVISFLMSCSIAAAVIANSKNGVGIGVITVGFFIATITFQMLRNRSFQKIVSGVTIIVIAAIIFGSAVLIHKRSTTRGWDTLFSDIEAAVQIDKYQAWRGPISSGETVPNNSLGLLAAGNTYERYAWMAAGAREVLRHPLGYGLINTQSFPLWLKKDGIKVDFQSSTHAGWLDLTLAFGLPSILIIFIVIVNIMILCALNSKKRFSTYLAGWIAISVFLAGFVQEITYKHTFEVMIFFITFCGACFVVIGKKHCSDRVLVGVSQS